MKRVLRFLFLVLAILMVNSCAHDIVDLTGSICGNVKDYNDAQLISNCSVTILPGGTSLTTGTDGFFEFKNLDPGKYTLSFRKSGYEDATADVTVVSGRTVDMQQTLKKLSAKMTVSVDKLDFESAVNTLSFDIVNSGGGDLEWSISENADWLSCAPAVGVVHPSQSVTIVASVKRTGLEKGNYSENIVVSTNVGSAVIPIIMSVVPLNITISPLALDYGTIDSSIDVFMSNPSGKTLKYSITTSNDWLSVSKTSGSLTTTDSFAAIVSRNGLGAGNYDGSILIKIESEEFSIPVRMKVAIKEKPTVSIEDVIEVNSNSAAIKATVKSVGSSKVVRYGVCWSLNDMPTVADSFINMGDCTGAKSFVASISNLEAETRYYVRAFAENNEGVAYSERVISFLTSKKPTLPSVSTLDIKNITVNSAVAIGRINSLGNVSKLIAHGHVWGTSPQPSILSCPHTDLMETGSEEEYLSDISSLSPATRYYIRAYATNSEGTAYGEDIVFTTLDYSVPTVIIGNASDIQAKSFYVEGNIVSDGGNSIIEHGHCWSLTPNPTIADNKTALGKKTDAGTFKSFVSSLSAGTIYYVRAYATNNKGIGYSDVITVTTSEGDKDVWDGTIATTFAGGSGISADPYVIKTGGQLLLMRNYSNKCFILAANIDLNNKNWLPFSFSGVLDGDGYTVSNLYIDRADKKLGLFSELLKGTVRNLNIKGVQINAPVNGGYYVGAVAGYSDYGRIENCSVILNHSSKMSGSTVGGIVGYCLYQCNISSCRVVIEDGAVFLGDKVGGITGEAGTSKLSYCVVSGHIQGACVGGISGSCCGPIEKSYYNGMLTSSNVAGGISGKARGDAYYYTDISECKAVVNIPSNNGQSYGGIVGEAEHCCCKASYVSGFISGNCNYSGGMMGYHYQSYASASFDHCYSAISSDSEIKCIGDNSYTDVKDCATTLASFGNKTKLTNCKASCSDITSFMREAYSDYADKWNFNNTWIWEGTISGSKVKVSCPKLSWE